MLLVVGTLGLALVPEAPWGWASRLAGSLGWCWVGTRIKMRSIVIWSLVFAAADGWGLAMRLLG